MARDNGRTPNIQKKLFGPFNGLNGTQSPFLRELPPSPNAKPQEFATELVNLIQNADSQELISRLGIEYVDGLTATSPALAAPAGIFKWTDYDIISGKPRERFVVLSVDADGVPSLLVYRFIRAQLRITSNTLNGKSFAIIEDPDATYAKKFMIYNADGTVFASSTTHDGLANTSVAYVDYDSTRDGVFTYDTPAGTDLLEPTEMTYSSVNGTPTSVAEFWLLAKKTVTTTGLDLSSWIDSLSTEDAVYWTAAQLNNVLYFSGGGLCPILKYDGQALYKAGMPHSAIHGSMTITGTILDTLLTGYGRDITFGSDGGLILGGETPGQFLGRFLWVSTYERGDAKNNFIEGEPYMPAGFGGFDSAGGAITLTSPVPIHYAQFDVDNSAADLVYTYAPKSLLSTDGYDARGALMPEDRITCNYTKSSSTVTVTFVAHPYVTNDVALIEFLTGPGVGDVVQSKITKLTADTFSFTTEAEVGGSGTLRITRLLRAANVTSDFALTVDSGNNTLKQDDLICIRALLFPFSTKVPYWDTNARIPILITARLAARASSTVTIDYDFPIQIEVMNGGDYASNFSDGDLDFGGVGFVEKEVLTTNLQSITTWADLWAWDWMKNDGVTGNAIQFPPEFCISNNLRINIYRNKGNAVEGNAYVPQDSESSVAPPVFLLNVLPNNPFSSTTSMGRNFDNCPDGILGGQLEEKVPFLIDSLGTDSDFANANYTSMPKGRYISTYKNRFYISDDPENSNILHRSSLLYGAEYFDVNDTLSMETPVGDDIKAVIGNDEAIFVLKDNSSKIIINDLENERIRIDDFTIGDFGCIAPRSAVQLESGVAYLTSTGPAWIQVNKEIVYLGENPNNISRIKDRLRDPELDLKRACAVVDTAKSLYKLYIPRITKASAGLYNPTDLRHSDNPYYNDDGVMFVFDYANDAWYEQAGINAKAGMVFLEQSAGERNMYLTSYAKNTSESVSTIEWALYKDRDYGNLWSYGDRLIRSGTVELREISSTYGTDWLAMEDANQLKKWLRCKIYAIRSFPDLTVLGTAATPSVASGDYELEITSYPSWRNDSIHSQDTIELTADNLFAFMKCRNMHAPVMRFRIVHETLFSTPRIQAIEVEATMPFKSKMKPWGVP